MLWAFLAGVTGCSQAAVIGSRDSGAKDTSSAPSQDAADVATLDAWILRTDIALPEVQPISRCSSDLHDRLDELGNVIETCPPDKGCLDGVCVAACTAVGGIVGNVGCDYLIPRPLVADYDSPCYAVFVANNWTKAVQISLSRDGTTYDVSRIARIPATGKPPTAWQSLTATGLPVGQVAVLFLEGGPKQLLGCPVETAVDSNTAIGLTGRGHAWHLVTDSPVSAYDIMPFGGAESFLPSAELLFPTTSWGTNYVAVMPMLSAPLHLDPSEGPQWAQIIAAENDTSVQIVPTVSLPSGSTVAAAPANAVTTYTLAAGEIVQWSPGSGAMEMTGSIISSNRPLAFVGGNGLMYIQTKTANQGGGESAHQQIPPVRALGSRYLAAPYATRISGGREESILYRVVGAKNGTVLTYEPAVPGSPSTLEQGKSADFEATGAFSVSSQDADHPFYIAQTMSGWDVPDYREGTLGDPEFVNMVPPAQYLSSYVFFTDPSYSTTALSLAQCDSGKGFEDVEVDCLGKVTGWKPIGSSGECRWTTVDLVRSGVGVGSCRNGPHSARSDEPFGLMVWGMDTAASYAYPAGALQTAINSVVVPPIPIP